MKTLISILLTGYFFLGSLMPGMDFCELLKIPDLVHHFREHEQTDEDLGFIAFLASHYGIENQEPSDEHQLPFKDHHCCASHTHSAITTHVALKLAPILYKRHPEDTYKFFHTSQFLATIWQPPRVS